MSTRNPTVRTEQAGRKRSLRKRILLAIVGFVSVMTVSASVWRVTADTKEKWLLFPFYDEGLMTQNLMLWLSGRTYGHENVLEALRATTSALRERHPDAHVAYMDVSGRLGGQLWPHKSHKEGIDVDIQFFGCNLFGGRSPSYPTLFLVGYPQNYGESGRFLWRTFDAERNWDFLMCLRTNGVLQVDKVLVEPHIKERLLAEGRRQNASPNLLEWADNTLRYAGLDAADHEDHMHIRFDSP